MSILAGFTLIDRPLVNQLVENAGVVVKKKWLSKKIIDPYRDLLEAHGTRLPNLEYKDYNGAVFLNVLQFLNESRGIDLSQSELQAEAKEITRKIKMDTFLLTYAQRLTYEEQLNPDTFDLEELLTFNIEFDGTGDPDFAIAAREAIKVIQNNLRAIPDEQHVLLFDLG